MLKVIIAGGGTGGHLFPGIAIAEEFKRKTEVKLIFVSVGNKLERETLSRLNFPLKTVRIEGIKGRNVRGVLLVLLKLPISFYDAWSILKEYLPDLVLGVGGYASFPVVMAARMMGIKTAIAEQNIEPGLTNRVLGKFVDKVFVNYGETRRWFPSAKVEVTGNPVRASFLAYRQRKNRKEGKFTVFIVGGSQGASAINRAALQALPHLVGKEIQFIHQTGEKDLSTVSQFYKFYGFEAQVSAFIEDMALTYHKADLVICRAGATTLSELTVMGKASLLIPYPYAANDHQKKNAMKLSKEGAAFLLEEENLDGLSLAEHITRFYENRRLLEEMGKKASTLAITDAAERIVDACLILALSRGKG